MQKDLGGLACYLSSAKSSYDIPKTIVFATTNVVCRCYAMLSKRAVQRKYVGMFHASMAPMTKATRVVDFTNGTIRCLVSTVAFGMVCTCTSCPILFVCTQSCVHL